MAYTLFGTKPMSGTVIAIPSMEWVENSQHRLEGLSSRKKKKLTREMVEFCKTYDLHLNWEKWVHWKAKKPPSPFLFRASPVDDDGLFTVDMINVKEAIFTLCKHYELFRTQLKQDFDPTKAALEFEDLQSSFWQEVFANHLLCGILYGYGKKNSYLFWLNREMENHPSTALIAHVVFDSALVKRDGKGGTLREIPLPVFRSYTQTKITEDPVIAKYAAFRAKIQKHLRGGSLTHKILERLYPRTENESINSFDSTDPAAARGEVTATR